MPELIAINQKEFAGRKWTPKKHFLFAAKDMICPLAAQEISTAVMALPIGFAPAEEGYEMVALLGFFKDKCTFVTPDGRWLTHYIPGSLQAYPFAMGFKDDTRVLCIDASSGHLLDEGADNEEALPFFDEQGELTDTIQSMLKILTEISQGRELVRELSKGLEAKGLLEDWPIEINTDQGPHRVEGLKRINEQRLNELAAEDLLQMQQDRSLTLAYCQLLSMQHLKDMVALENAQAEVASKASDFKLETGSDSGTINFDNL